MGENKITVDDVYEFVKSGNISRNGMHPNKEMTTDYQKQQLRLMAKANYQLFNLYKENEEILGIDFLRYMSSWFLRQWPNKDLPKSSKNAEKLAMKKFGKSVAGIDRKEVQKLFKELGEKMSDNLRFEHIVPLKYFSDVLLMRNDISEEAYIDFVVENYQTAWITIHEDKQLAKSGYRFKRPSTAYEEVKIALN